MLNISQITSEFDAHFVRVHTHECLVKWNEFQTDYEDAIIRKYCDEVHRATGKEVSPQQGFDALQGNPLWNATIAQQKIRDLDRLWDLTNFVRANGFDDRGGKERTLFLSGETIELLMSWPTTKDFPEAIRKYLLPDK